MTTAHRRQRLPALLLLCAMLTPAVGLAEEREQLLAFARDRNRAAILSIARMECRYERRPWGNTTLEQAKKPWAMPTGPGSFWRSGDVFRLFEPGEEGFGKDYVDASRQRLSRSITNDASGSHPMLALDTRRTRSVGGEVWEYLLFSHWGSRDVSFLPFYDLLQEPYQLHAAKRLPPPGDEIYVDLSHAGGRMEFWFDPRANYLIRKSTVYPQASLTIRWEHEVIKLAEPAPLVFVPTIVEHRFFEAGELQAVIRTAITELKVNHAMNEDALRLPEIAGMRCVDPDQNVSYMVDADGNRIGPNVSIGQQAANLKIPLSEPREPAASWRDYVWFVSVVVIISLVVLGTRFALAVIRRKTMLPTN